VRIHALFRTECQSFLDGASARTWCSWPEIIADLDSLTETEIEHDGKRFIVRSAPRSSASLALRAAGVALPPTVRDAARAPCFRAFLLPLGAPPAAPCIRQTQCPRTGAWHWSPHRFALARTTTACEV
jgi:hypothetical protein